MNLSNIKSVTPLAFYRPRSVVWTDMRSRSPKSIGDYSGVNAPRLAPATMFGLQQLDYDQLARVFVCSDMIWTCISYVAKTTALAHLEVQRRVNNTYITENDHPFMRMLKMPNEDMTEYDFWEAWTTHQLLYGKFCSLLIREPYIKLFEQLRFELNDRGMIVTEQIVDAAREVAMRRALMDDKSPVVGIIPVHPSIVDTIFNSGRKKWEGYRYEFAPGRTAEVHPSNVVSDPLYNPEIGGVGVSPTYMAFRWLRLDNAMNTQLFQYFENGAIPSMIISLKRPQQGWTGGNDTPEKMLDSMKSRWLTRFANRGKEPKTPAFLYGDVDVKEIEQRIDEMMSKGVFYEIQTRICGLFGCPTEIFEVGIRFNSQRASAQQAQENYYNTSVQPRHERIRQKLSALVLPSYGLENNDERLAWNYENMGIATFLEEARRKNVYKKWEMGLISRDEARIKLGEEPVGGELGDDYYRLTVTGNETSQNQGKNQTDGENLQVQGGQNPPITDNRLKVSYS